MKTKDEIIEEIEQVMLLQELQNMRIMDALGNALDYVRSSQDQRAEMYAYFNDPNERAKYDPTYEGYTGTKESEEQNAERK